MDIYALDENFDVVDVAIPYANLQWTRRYYTFGEFQVQIPLSVYDGRWKYIGTADRPELGIIQKIMETGDNEVMVLLSGFFCEKMLDDKTCYPRFINDNSRTETAVRKLFDTYKDDLPINLGEENEPPLGDRTQSNFSDDQLGTKMFKMLESRELSYRVMYDYIENNLELTIWQGKDRTQRQKRNSYQVFSLEFGNIGTRNINIDESNYKNYAIVPCDGQGNDNIEAYTYYVDLSNGGYKREIVIGMREEHPEEDEKIEDFKLRIEQAALEKLLDYQIVNEMDVTPVSDIGYMIDYDLGDKCDVVLSDIDVSLETRIVEIAEVFKADGGHTITVGLGNKRMSNLQRLAAKL